MDHLISSISDSMLVLSTGGVIRAANGAAQRLFGYREDELLMQPLSLVLAQEDDPLFGERCVAEALKKGTSAPRATRCRTMAGATMPVTISLSVVYSAVGVEKGIICLVKEMTEAQPLAALQPSADFFKTIINALPDAAMIIDARDFTILAANTAFLREVGMAEADVRGRPCYAVSHKTNNVGTPPGGSCPMLETLSAEKFAVSEHVFYRDGKISKIAEVSTTPIFDDAGKLIYTLHLSHEITNRRLYEDEIRAMARRLEHANGELQQANDDLKSFASIVSHDMRSPLVSIKGFAGEIRQTVQEVTIELADYLAAVDEERRQRLAGLLETDIGEALDFISSSVNRLDSMIISMLQLSRIGYRSFLADQVDTAELVRVILTSLGHQLEQKQVAVTTDNLPVIEADRVAMGQIFGNLIDNAIKYLEPSRPGALTIDSTLDEEHVTFRVRDNGRGIAAADRDKVFQLFTRVGRQNVAGEGMGLAFVKTLVRRLGGNIWCESTEGVGTTFSFTLPTRAVREAEPEPVPEEPDAMGLD